MVDSMISEANLKGGIAGAYSGAANGLGMNRAFDYVNSTQFYTYTPWESSLPLTSDSNVSDPNASDSGDSIFGPPEGVIPNNLLSLNGPNNNSNGTQSLPVTTGPNGSNVAPYNSGQNQGGYQFPQMPNQNYNGYDQNQAAAFFQGFIAGVVSLLSWIFQGLGYDFNNFGFGKNVNDSCPIHGNQKEVRSVNDNCPIHGTQQETDVCPVHGPKGKSKTEDGACPIHKTKEEVSAARQKAVDNVLDSNEANVRFEMLAEKFEATDAESLEKALEDLQVYDNSYFAAFKQYLENNGKSLDDIIQKAKDAGVEKDIIDNVRIQDAMVQDWLEAYGIEPAKVERTEFEDGLCPVHKTKEEVVDARQEAVEELLTSFETNKVFEMLLEKIETANAKELGNILSRGLANMDDVEFAAFKQYLERQGKSLYDILDNAKNAGVNKDSINQVDLRYSQVLDWLEAYDIKE